VLFFRRAKTCNEKIVDYAYPVKEAIIISPLSGLSPEFPPKILWYKKGVEIEKKRGYLSPKAVLGKTETTWSQSATNC